MCAIFDHGTEPLALFTSRIDPHMRAGPSIHGIEKLGDLHNHLSSLSHHELFALQTRQMLGNSWPRGADQVGDVLMAESYPQQRAARFLDSEVRAQLQQRDGYSFVQAKVEKTRAAEQEAVPLLQIVAVKLLEGGLGSIWGNAAEIGPAHSSNAAIVVSLALKTRVTERQHWKFRNRSGRQQRHRDTLVARTAAGDSRNSRQQNVSTLGLRNVAQNQRVSFVVGKREGTCQKLKLRRRKPRQNLESAQSVEVCFAGSSFLIQNRTAQDRAYTPLALTTDKPEA